MHRVVGSPFEVSFLTSQQGEQIGRYPELARYLFDRGEAWFSLSRL